MAPFDRLRLRVKSRLQFLRAGLIWAVRDVHAGLTLKPIAGGAPEGGDGGDAGDGGGDAGGKGKGDEGGKGSEGGKGDEGERVTPEDDWEAKARKNETRAERAERELKEERTKREEREESEKTEHQKEIDKAKKEGESEAGKSAQKERRADRLELAVTKLAGKKLKLGSGDDAEEARFADSDDAQLYLERAISKGELDEDAIFDKDGKIDIDKVEAELVSILKRKPHLRDGGSEEGAKGKGDPDVRKGEPASGDLDSLSVEDHVKRKYGGGK